LHWLADINVTLPGCVTPEERHPNDLGFLCHGTTRLPNRDREVTPKGVVFTGPEVLHARDLADVVVALLTDLVTRSLVELHLFPSIGKS